jgi:hypothetical protein
MPIAMTLLVLAALGGFAFTARKRLTLLLAGAPENRFDRLFDRMAAPPNGTKPDLAGTILVAGIFALPATALVLGLAAFVAPVDPIVTPVLRVGGGGGHLLLGAARADEDAQVRLRGHRALRDLHGVRDALAAHDHPRGPRLRRALLPLAPRPQQARCRAFARSASATTLLKDVVVGIGARGVLYFIKAFACEAEAPRLRLARDGGARRHRHDDAHRHAVRRRAIEGRAGDAAGRRHRGAHIHGSGETGENLGRLWRRCCAAR